MKKVLVTGANGYIAKHIIADLYKNKFSVIGTLRNIQKAKTVQSDIENHLGHKIDIAFKEVCLDSDEGWDDAVSGCDAIMHTASPFPIKYVKNEMDLINPAKEGTLRVMNAAKNNSIDRIIVTSSNAAVYAGNKHITSFDETMWSNLDSKNVRAYTKSKTVAEKAAWEFAKKNSSIVLTTINPVLVWGPGIGNHSSSASLKIFDMLIKKALPMVPKVKMPLVDVRDVSMAHVNALKLKNAENQRFLICQGTYWFYDICKILIEMNISAPNKQAPSFLIRFLSLFDKKLKEITPFLDYNFEIKSDKAKKIIDFNPIKLEKTLKDTKSYLSNLLNN